MNESFHTMRGHRPNSGLCPFSILRLFSWSAGPLARVPNRFLPPCYRPIAGTTAPKPGLKRLQENPI